jgi:hypothetical protein
VDSTPQQTCRDQKNIPEPMADGDVATNTTTYAPKWPAQTHAMRCIPVACRWRILDTWWTPTTPPDAPSRPMPRPNMATHTMHVLVIVMHFPRRHMRVLLEQHVPFPAHAPPPPPANTRTPLAQICSVQGGSRLHAASRHGHPVSMHATNQCSVLHTMDNCQSHWDGSML